MVLRVNNHSIKLMKISCVKFSARLCQTNFLLRRIFLDLRYVDITVCLTDG